MTDPKGTWSDGGKVWEGEPQALAATPARPTPTNARYSTERLEMQLMDTYNVSGDQVFYQASKRLEEQRIALAAATPAATRNVLAMTTDENLHATPAVGILSREKSDRILSECGYGPAGGKDGLRDCLQSIADISEEEPREPDDADWRFRCLEAIRAAKAALAAPQALAATPPLRSAALKALNYIENTECELGIKLGCGDDLRAALAATPAVGGEMVLHPLSEIREWDEALRELGIQDSTTTPAEAVRALNAEIEELRAAQPASPLRGVTDWRAKYREVFNENKRLRAAIDWVDSWVSNPVGAYSVAALDGLFARTRDRIAALSASPPEQPAADPETGPSPGYRLIEEPCEHPECEFPSCGCEVPTTPDKEPELPAARPMGQS